MNTTTVCSRLFNFPFNSTLLQVQFSSCFLYLEHFLIEGVEEGSGGCGWVGGALVVVHLQILEVLLEDLRILLVHDPVGPGEHVVELALGLVQQHVHVV